MSQKWKTFSQGKMITGPHWKKQSPCLNIASMWNTCKLAGVSFHVAPHLKLRVLHNKLVLYSIILYSRITELRLLSFQIGEARALYNLGNVYHAKGKHFGRNFHQDPGEFPEEVRSALERAIEFYE